jgi:hypothetical protein
MLEIELAQKTMAHDHIALLCDDKAQQVMNEYCEFNYLDQICNW